MDALTAADDAAHPTPEELRRIADGDPTVLGSLYDQYAPRIFGVALRVTGDRAAAEDVVQDTFVALWRNASRFDPVRATFRTWLLSIAHHRAVDVVRRRHTVEHSLDSDDGYATTVASSVDVWSEVAARYDGADVRRRVAQLTSAQRECIELAYFAGLTQPEIAERTGTPLGTIKSRVRVGLRRLQEGLTEEQTSNRHSPRMADREERVFARLPD